VFGAGTSQAEASVAQAKDVIWQEGPAAVLDAAAIDAYRHRLESLTAQLDSARPDRRPPDQRTDRS